MDLAQFYDQYVEKVYKFFYIKCLDRHTAEDLTSQTFLSFVEHLRGETTINDHKKYLYGIMRNNWLKFLRAKYEEALSGLENIEDFEDYTQKHIDEFEAVPITSRLVPFVNKLPTRQRNVLHLRLVQGLSVGDTAKELGKDKNYVKTTQRRGILSLREMLRKPYLYGGGPGV